MQLLTISQVAQRVGISVRTVRREIRKGRLPATKLGYRTVRVSETDLAIYLEKRKVLPSIPDRSGL